MYCHHLVCSPPGEGGEHGDPSTEHGAGALQGVAIRDLDDEPLRHGVTLRVAAVCPARVGLDVAILYLSVISRD